MVTASLWRNVEFLGRGVIWRLRLMEPIGFQYAKPLPNYCSIYDTPDFDVGLATDGTRLVTVGSISTNAFYIYNGFIYTSDPLVGVRMTNNPTPKVAISGLVGRNYQIQSTDALGAGNNW